MREHGMLADQAAVRRTNLARVLGEIRRPGAHSRATIAARTGLTKATVSSLVAELIERRLVRDRGLRRDGAVGRPGRLLELDGGSAAALGLEINANSLAVRVVDIAGREVFERRVGFDAMHATAAHAVDELAALAGEGLARMSRTGAELVGVGVAVPGLVEVTSGSVRYAPNLPWQDVPIAEWLRVRLKLPDGVPLVVENEANLAALAEFRSGTAQSTPDLVYLTGDVGIGAGLIVDGRLLRGSDGFSGEIGHIPVDPGGATCGCGRRGCLETKIGLAAAVRAIAPDMDGMDGDPEELAALLRRRADAGEPRALAGLDDIGRWLGTGISIIVNMINPGAVVLGGYFAVVAAYLVPAAMRELRARVVAGDAATCRIYGSAFGFTAAVRGATGVVVEEVFQNPVRPRMSALHPPNMSPSP